MKVFEGNWAAAAAMLGAILVSAPALAQAPAAAAPQAKPDVSTFDDWQVRCFPVQSPSPCDMFQEQGYQRTNQRILSISVAYVPGLDRYALQISVPLDIAIPKGVTIQTDSYTSPAMRYRRCDRNGCYVEMGADKNLIESIVRSSPDGKGKVNIVADNGRSVGIPFSLKGLAAAHDDMVSKAKAKAKPISQQNTAAPAAPQQ